MLQVHLPGADADVQQYPRSLVCWQYLPDGVFFALVDLFIYVCLQYKLHTTANEKKGQ